MRRRITAVLGLLSLVLGAPASARAVQGGLSALPPVKLGSNLLTNGSFETIGSPPVNWNGGSNWNVDQIVKKSGTYSWRRGTGAPTATQKVTLRKGTYKLSAWIKTETLGSASAGVRLQLDLRPGVNFWYKTGVISGTADWKLHELKNIVLTEDREVTVKLENFANPSGTAWFDDIKLEEQQPEPVNAFLLYPNYRGILFTDKPQTMRVDVTVTPPGDDFAKYAVRATLADETSGTEVRSQTYPASAHFVAQLDGSAMQTGKGYLLRVALVDTATGATVYTYPAYRVSRLPGSARASMNVAFDEKNRLLVRGTPRFLLGVYDAGMGYGTTDQFWEDKLWSPSGERRMNGLKLNFYLNYWYGEAPAAAMTSLMANLQKHGVMYLQTGNCFNTRPAGDNFLINSSADYVRDLGGHPGAGGFYTVDECISALAPGAFAQTKRLRELAPGTVTFGALFGDPDIVFWRDTVDVLSSDPYPMFGAEPAGGYDHGQVAEWTAQTRTAVKDARPFMTVLQFFKFTSKGRWPTRQEMRNHAYMAIVEGARGLWWWSLGTNALKDVCAGWCEQKTTSMNNLKAVVNELAALEPVLLADDSPAALKTNSNPSAIRTKVKLHGGKGYVFAYNRTNQRVSATFTWNTTPGTVAVNGENRTLAAAGNRFTDSFGPYQAHVYVIGAGGSGGNDPTPIPDPAAEPDPDPDPDPDPAPNPTPPPSGGTPPPATGALAVSFPSLTSGQVVSGGSVPVSIRATGTTGTQNKFYISVDGTQRDFWVVSGTEIRWWWTLTSLSAGNHTLSVRIVDASGKTGTGSITVQRP